MDPGRLFQQQGRVRTDRVQGRHPSQQSSRARISMLHAVTNAAIAVHVSVLHRRILPQRPAGLMAVLDDVCATMHGQSDGADVKFVEVRRRPRARGRIAPRESALTRPQRRVGWRTCGRRHASRKRLGPWEIILTSRA